MNFSEQPVRCEQEGWGISQDQAIICARRARLVSSPETADYCRSLEYCWLRLVEQAQETGRRVDCPGRTLLAPDFKAKGANTARQVVPLRIEQERGVLDRASHHRR